MLVGIHAERATDAADLGDVDVQQVAFQIHLS